MLKLMKYELRKNRSLLLGLLVTIAALQGYFLTSLALGKEEHMAAAFTILPMVGLIGAIIVFFVGVTSYSKELSQKSSYLIFMTPHSTLSIVASKMLYTLTLGVALMGIMGGLMSMNVPLFFNELGEWKGYAFMLDTLLAETGLSINSFLLTALLFVVMVLLNVLRMLGLAYLSFTLSSTLLQNRKAKGIVALALFVALNYGLIKLSALWMPENVLYLLETLQDVIRLCIPQVIESAVVLVMSMVGSAWLLDRYVSL